MKNQSRTVKYYDQPKIMKTHEKKRTPPRKHERPTIKHEETNQKPQNGIMGSLHSLGSVCDV